MTFQLKIIVFLVASAGLVWLSWSSLRNLRSHGFYRFFAFEAIVILILLNIDYWFYEPFSIHQIVSWLLLIISLFLVIHGFQLLHKVGKPDSKRKDSSLIGKGKDNRFSGGGSLSLHPASYLWFAAISGMGSVFQAAFLDKFFSGCYYNFFSYSYC